MDNIQHFLEDFFISKTHTAREAVAELTNRGLTKEEANAEVTKFFRVHPQAGFDVHPQIIVKRPE